MSAARRPGSFPTRVMRYVEPPLTKKGADCGQSSASRKRCLVRNVPLHELWQRDPNGLEDAHPTLSVLRKRGVGDGLGRRQRQRPLSRPRVVVSRLRWLVLAWAGRKAWSIWRSRLPAAGDVLIARSLPPEQPTRFCSPQVRAQGTRGTPGNGSAGCVSAGVTRPPTCSRAPLPHLVFRRAAERRSLRGERGCSPRTRAECTGPLEASPPAGAA
jgi:hypothetical protein